jgi:plasmid stabilization system protein ParE
VVPAAQQCAEKIYACTFPYQDWDDAWVKELVDLVLLMHSGLLEAVQVWQALQATFRLRAMHPLTAELPKPPDAWSESFAALAIELRLRVQDLEQAHAYLSAFWRSHGLGEITESGEEA